MFISDAKPQKGKLDFNLGKAFVTWKASEDPNGVLHNYTVSWYRESELISIATTRELRYSVAGLEACVNYTVKVAATTWAGKGEQAIIMGQYNGTTIKQGLYKKVTNVCFYCLLN